MLFDGNGVGSSENTSSVLPLWLSTRPRAPGTETTVAPAAKLLVSKISTAPARVAPLAMVFLSATKTKRSSDEIAKLSVGLRKARLHFAASAGLSITTTLLHPLL